MVSLGFLPTFLTKQLRASGGAARLKGLKGAAEGETLRYEPRFCLSAYSSCISHLVRTSFLLAMLPTGPHVSCSAVSASTFLIFVKRFYIFILQWGLVNHIAYSHGQRTKCLDGITDSTDMNLGKLQEMVQDGGAWHTVVHEVAKSWT